MKVTLKGKTEENLVSTKKRKEILKTLGIEVENLSQTELEKTGIMAGVKITNVYIGKIKQQTDIRKDFVITKLNNQSVGSVEEFVKILEENSGVIMLKGVYLNKPYPKYYYAFGS